MCEIWKDVRGYEGYYQVSNMGRLKSCARTVKVHRNSGLISYTTYPEKIMRVSESVSLKRGSIKYRVTLHKEGEVSRKDLAWIVADTFIGPRPENGYIKHINGDVGDNRAENLCYRIYNRKIAA